MIIRVLSRYFSFVLLLASLSTVYAQPAAPPLGNGPWLMDTFEEDDVRVSILTRSLDHPFGMVFIPGTRTAQNPLGDVLITERTGKVRLFRNGQLLDDAVEDLAAVFPLEQLYDIKLHPQFEQNGLVYFTYIKTAQNPDGSDDYWVSTALARGQFKGEELLNLEDIFVADAWSSNFGGASSRLHFLADGTLLFAVSHRLDPDAPQSLSSHLGKVLRLNDDGSVPADNPYVDVAGALPEIYTLGNRSIMDFVTHPVTGDVWELENGPQGGDEINVIKLGTNYGWPIATYGRDYDGTLMNPLPWVEGTELPITFWVPSITVAGMSFYTGEKFPNWQGSLFVTSMVTGRVPGTGHIERLVFNEFGEIRREQMLNSLRQRIRYISQGPDDLLYLLTDDDNGALLRMEPNSIVNNVTGNREDINSSELFSSADCKTCHQSDTPMVGPMYRDIAKRYSLNEANITFLARKIIQGGGGAWGEVPMAPHADIQEAKAREMVMQVLGLEQ